jgi:hypothetical protein
VNGIEVDQWFRPISDKDCANCFGIDTCNHGFLVMPIYADPSPSLCGHGTIAVSQSPPPDWSLILVLSTSSLVQLEKKRKQMKWVKYGGY